MAITKLPRNAIADDAIDASKIEDGTVTVAEVSGTITNAKLKDGDIANAKLSNSTITIRGNSRALGDTFTLNVDVDWQSVVTSDGSTVTTMEAGKGYFVDNTSASGLVKLPTSASAGDTIAIKDYAEKFGTNSLIIQRNGHKIQGNETNSEIDTNRASLVLVYVDTTKGWLYTTESNVAALDAPAFISATGGTVTTSGDFKIHSFTGDGCFVVSALGNGPAGTGRNPAGGPAAVDYLVVAGGGAGGRSMGGGGGAGGYRTSGFGPSPLRGTAITATVTTFPITVGGGGAAGPGSVGASGSNSIFSTITSTGGGGGGNEQNAGGNGGSGGGAGGHGGATPGIYSGGSGNTPPTSPSQGSAGGNSTGKPPDTTRRAGGGGGALEAGNTDGQNQGGDGAPNAITGSDTSYAGGGAGGGEQTDGPFSGAPFAGGDGGGGPSGDSGGNDPGTDGTANTGGGGGGGSRTSGGGVGLGASGGKGIVIIRYKFQ